MASQRPTGNLVEIIERHGKDINRLKRRMSGLDLISDHGDLTGLSGDDHTQYLLASGARAMSGTLDMGGNTIDNILVADVNEVQADAGAVSDPSYTFRSDPDTGAYRRSTNQFSIATGGVHRALFYSGGLIVGQVATGDPRIQGGGNYSWHGDTDTYMDRPSSNAVRIVTAGTEIVRFTRATTERTQLTFGIAADTYIQGYRTGTTDRLVLHANDLIFSDTIYGSTSVANANVIVGGSPGGDLRRSTSSLEFKEGWEFVDETALAQLTLPTPITWEDEDIGIMLGFGTEHIYDMLPAATQDFRDSDGKPENYDTRTLVAILSAKVKRLEAALEL